VLRYKIYGLHSWILTFILFVNIELSNTLYLEPFDRSIIHENLMNNVG